MKNKRMKQVISCILVMAVVFGGFWLDYIPSNADEEKNDITLYLIDNTVEQWLEDDAAVMELVDNTNGHHAYTMTKVTAGTWSVCVPKTAYNVTFNRYNEDKTIRWNSWSAGGRDGNNAYYADGSEYGHWGMVKEDNEENYFHAGDVVYLDVSEFTAWERDDAFMYVNFTDASKEENGGNDVEVKNSNFNQYNPKLVDYEAPEHIYAYIVETKDEGRTKLRFWRGNEAVLWNCSAVLTYDEYKKGKNCIKVHGWDLQGISCMGEYDIDCEVDTDEDGIPNYFEAVTGLDKRNTDTDGDGLNDFEELFVTDTNPAKFDSVTENISDADIDSDNDGLTNIQEIDFETNPKSADTDNDGLTDFEEIYVYGTNPIEPDSDEDGLNDGDEIVLGLNPNKPDSDDNGIPDGEEYIEQIVAGNRFKEAVFENNTAVPSLTVFARGNVNNNICISEYTGHLKGDERAYVGKVIEISGSQINGGRLTFHLSDGYRVKEYQLNEETTNGLLICYNDGEETIPLDTVYDEESRTLYADISSGGIYFVMDVVSWLESLGIEGTPNLCMSAQKSMKRLSAAMSSAEDVSIGEHRIGGQVDIVFVVDTTGSMGGYIQNVKNNLTAFVNEIEAAGITPYFALVDYRDITADGQYSTNVKKNSDGGNWFKNTQEFKAKIAELGVDGGGDGPETPIDGLEMARRLDLRASSQKFFILVTDADYKNNNNYGIQSMNEMVDLLVDSDINVSVVSNLNCRSVYQSLYESTGGVFANVGGNFKDELLTIAGMIEEETNNGYWIALNGLIPRIVKLKEKPDVNGTADTDLDGLRDIKELKSTEPERQMKISQYLRYLGLPADYAYPTIPVYGYYSDPTRKDSDDDGLEDGRAVYVYGKKVVPKDSQPLVKNGTKEIWQAHIENEKYGVISTEYSNASGFDVSVDKKIADKFVKYLLKIRNTVNKNEKYIRKVVLSFKKIFEGNTKAGAYILNFIYDADHQAYHSQPDTWQKEFGYNAFYDDVFRIGSYMDYGKIIFDCNGKKYALWMWKGDYWNLQSGAEIGLYTYNTSYSNIKHYDVVDFEVPMSLFLYNYYAKDDIENVFSWRPRVKQWWITGFNPKFKEPKPKEMVTIGTIDLAGASSIYYSALKKNDNEFDKINKHNIVFDDDSNRVWIIWYNEEQVS